MKTSDHLAVGSAYTRKEMRRLFGVKDANLNKGVFRPRGHDSVWLFVTEDKGADRTQYADYLDGDVLHWDGQVQGRTNHLIINHNELQLELLVFYRQHRYTFPGAGFRYEGEFEYYSHTGEYPTHFVLRRVRSLQAIVEQDIQTELEEHEYFEGGQGKRYTSYYERDPRIRLDAIAYHGTTCMVCGFNFETMYGVHGSGFIEVHHLKPVSTLKEKARVDPKTDMAVVCANCHRMIHRRKNKILALDEVRAMLHSAQPGLIHYSEE